MFSDLFPDNSRMDYMASLPSPWGLIVPILFIALIAMSFGSIVYGMYRCR